MRLTNPAARALPLLTAIGTRSSQTVRLELFDEQRVRIEVSPCP